MRAMNQLQLKSLYKQRNSKILNHISLILYSFLPDYRFQSSFVTLFTNNVRLPKKDKNSTIIYPSPSFPCY